MKKQLFYEAQLQPGMPIASPPDDVYREISQAGEGTLWTFEIHRHDPEPETVLDKAIKALTGLSEYDAVGYERLTRAIDELIKAAGEKEPAAAQADGSGPTQEQVKLWLSVAFGSAHAIARGYPETGDGFGELARLAWTAAREGMGPKSEFEATAPTPPPSGLPTEEEVCEVASSWLERPVKSFSRLDGYAEEWKRAVALAFRLARRGYVPAGELEQVKAELVDTEQHRVKFHSAICGWQQFAYELIGLTKPLSDAEAQASITAELTTLRARVVLPMSDETRTELAKVVQRALNNCGTWEQFSENVRDSYLSVVDAIAPRIARVGVPLRELSDEELLAAKKGADAWFDSGADREFSLRQHPPEKTRWFQRDRLFAHAVILKATSVSDG